MPKHYLYNAYKNTTVYICFKYVWNLLNSSWMSASTGFVKYHFKFTYIPTFPWFLKSYDVVYTLWLRKIGVRSGSPFLQSYEIKFPPRTILWFKILRIFSVENIKMLGVFMFQTWDNCQLCTDSQDSSQ